MRISQFPHISPRLWDTDGDGIADPSDLDPRRDCMVEVEIGKASVPRSYIDKKYGGKVDKFDRLQAGIVLGSSFDHQGIYTKKEDATITGTKCTKDFKDKYYFDINDDVRTFRLDKVMLFGQLAGYHSRGWYPVELDGSRAARTFRFQTSEKEESKTFGSGSRYVELDYKVVTLERAHTIHVYENGTYSEQYGRYYTPEKMAVLQIHVTSENTAGSPFVTGLNTILAPSSAFLNSKLNSIVQTVGSANQSEYEEEVPDCLKSETGKTKFQGIDRNNPDEQMSDWIEVMITKQDCSLYHAKQILNLTLTGIVNESSEEMGILYEYDADPAHPAELANLAYDVLKAVPVLSSYQNSPTGSAPRLAERLVKKDFGDILAGVNIWELGDWLEALEEMWDLLMDWFESLIEAFLDLLSDLVAFVMDAVEKVAEALGNLVHAVAEAGLTLVKAVAAAAKEALENLLKAALLAFIYTMFAVTLVALAFEFAVISGILLLCKELFGFRVDAAINSVHFEKGEFSFGMGYIPGMQYHEFLDTDIPAVIFFFEYNEIHYERYANYYQFEVAFPVMDIFQAISEDVSSEQNTLSNSESGEGTQLATGGLNTEDTNSTDLNEISIQTQEGGENSEITFKWSDFLNGFGAMTGIFGSSMSIAGGIWQTSELDPEPKQLIKTYISIGLLLGSTYVLRKQLSQDPSFGFILGLVIGSLISSLTALSASSERGKPNVIRTIEKLWVDIVLSVFSLVLSWFGLYYEVPDFTSILQTVIGIVLLSVGFYAISGIRTFSVRNILSATYFGIGWVITLILIPLIHIYFLLGKRV